MKRSVICAVCVAAMSTAAAAQSDVTMDKKATMSDMNPGAMKGTYAGCLEGGTTPGTFILAHAERVNSGSMKRDASGHDAPGQEMSEPTNLPVASTVIGLTKYVGHKVSVTGSSAAKETMAHETPAHGKDAQLDAMMSGQSVMSRGAAQFTVHKLKVLAAACS
jgi:hypothetical protein